MKIALITAMDVEYDELKALFNSGDGALNINGNILTLSKCGMGKVNAAIVSERLCNQGVDLILFVGIAGGIDSSLNLGDVVVSTKLAYHDVWCGKPNQKGQVQDLPLYFDSPLFNKISFEDPNIKKGLILTGDQFVTEKEQLTKIKETFPEALAVDMESAAVAHVCYLNKIPFSAIRMISDVVGAEYQEETYKNFWNIFPHKLAESTKKILELL